MQTRAWSFVLGAFLYWAGVAQGHHSTASFDMDALMTLEGTVTEFNWSNPHVYIFLETVNEVGAIVEWELEASSTPNLVRRGWSADALSPGDLVTVQVNPPRDGTRAHARAHVFTKADGSTLGVRASGSILGPAGPDAVAATLSGTWLGQYRLRQVAVNLAAWPLTAKGRAALARYDGSQNPQAECIPVAAPLIMLYSNLYSVDVREDRVVLGIEWMNVERVVYLDGRGHPAGGGRSNQGRSIGSWEGEALVVDTRGFTDHGAGNAFEIPSGAQKHLIERFTLSEDGRQIEYEYVLEDPEYLTEPVRGTGLWDYRPDLAPLPNDCDPEVARRFLGEG